MAEASSKDRVGNAPSVVLRASEIVVLVVWHETWALGYLKSILPPSEFHVIMAESGLEAVGLYRQRQDEINLVRCAFMTAHAPCVVEDVMTEEQRRAVVGWFWKPWRVPEFVGAVRELSLR